MSSENNYVINITNELSDEVRHQFAMIGQDLLAIKDKSWCVDSIVLRGGAVVDILMDLEPNDFDLFYSYLEDGHITSECRCDEVRESLSQVKLCYIDKACIDLENSYEKEPKADPLTRTCDLISFHTDYFSMFAVDEDGQVWTNVQAWKNFQDKVYEIRYEGCLLWAYFPTASDSQNYYASLAGDVVRGIGYIAKRKLKAGTNFEVLLGHLPYYLDKTRQQTGLERVRAIAHKKIGSYQTAERVLDNIALDNSSKVKQCLKELFK